MNMTRRTILKAGAGTALAMAAGRLSAGEPQQKTLLVLGGTGFIGPHVTELALARGWRVTHFNRGKRDPDGVENVETLLGDRKGQLDALKSRSWDAVVDNTGYIPKFEKMSADLLAPSTGYCLYISSISAYAGFEKPNDENSPRGVLANIDEEQITNESYGPMKALCEDYVRQAYGSRSSIVRPGYIVGPLDPTDRFTYWPVRVARGGEMAVPGTPADPIQIIDVRDLAQLHDGSRRTPRGRILQRGHAARCDHDGRADRLEQAHFRRRCPADLDRRGFRRVGADARGNEFRPLGPDARRRGRCLADRHHALGGRRPDEPPPRRHRPRHARLACDPPAGTAGGAALRPLRRAGSEAAGGLARAKTGLNGGAGGTGPVRR